VKKVKSIDPRVGKYSFIVGVVIAVVLGLGIAALAPAQALLTSLLVLLGLIVGFMNVASKDLKDFLLIATILVLVSYAGSAGAILGSVQMIGQYLQGIFNSIMAFVVPAVIVAGLKAIAQMAKTSKKK
jgi:hypothetical protein